MLSWILSDKLFRRDVQTLVHELKSILPATQWLFPLYGITLGKTSEIELARVARKDKDFYDRSGWIRFNSYLYNGLKFGVVGGICTYLKVVNGIPQQWEQLGSRQQNSYNEWLAILDGFGYTITVALKPSHNRINNRDFFQAEVFARKENPFLHLLKLQFYKESATLTRTPGTLDSIEIEAMESSGIDKAVACELDRVKQVYHSGYGLLGLGAELI